MTPFLLLCLATFALAAPANLGLFVKRADINATTISYNPLLPNITIYATGGTIAGSASSNLDTTGYTSGVLGVQVLINAVPDLVNISNVAGVQISNVASGEVRTIYSLHTCIGGTLLTTLSTAHTR
jgi:L-asparaginase